MYTPLTRSECDGIIKDYPGNYTDYRESKKKQTPIIKNELAPTKTQKTKTDPKKLSFGEKRELEQLEKALEELEKSKVSLVNNLNSNEQDFEKLAEWGKELKQIEQTIDTNEYRWLELNEGI